MNFNKQLIILTSFLFLFSFQGNSQSPVGAVGSGCAMGFDGDDDYIEIPASDDFTPGLGAITVSMWVNFSNLSSGEQKIFDWYPYGITEVSSNSARYKFKVNNSLLTWEVKDDDNNSRNNSMSFNTFSSPFDGQWHFITGTIDVQANQTQLFFDGVLISSNNNVISSLTTAGADIPIQIAREYYAPSNPSSIQHFNGEIDEIRVWDYARTENQIREDMCRSLEGNESGLVAFWNFNQCEGETLLDLTGNGHDGSIYNAPTWKTSGAPLGNVSTYLYTADWTSTSLGMSINGEDSLVVSDVTNSPEGIHIYSVDMEPNTLDTIAMILGNDRYFGVYSTHVDGQTPPDYGINYHYNNQPFVTPLYIDYLGLYTREENDSTLWHALPSINNIFDEEVTFAPENNRGEYMLGTVLTGCDLDLGEDLEVCFPDTVNLAIPGNWLFTSWSTGDTLPQIDVTSTGTFIAFVTDTLGCNTSDTILVTVNPTYDYINPVTICAGDSILLGGMYQTTAGVYLDSLTTAAGCDSIVHTDLSLVLPTTNTITETVCDSFTSPNDYVWTTSGIYSDTLVNSAGCDSIITYDLTVNNTTYGSASIIACNEYLSPSGNYLWTTSGEKMDTITNALGCDSVLSIVLIINPSTFSSITELACDEYISPSGNIWTQSGNYTDTIPNIYNCDSIISIELEVVITPSPIILTDEYACMRESEFTMEAEDPGGVWSGNGIVDEDNGTFDPSSVGIGFYDITYFLDGDCPAQSVYQLEVIDCELLWQHFYVPNIFSPNGDSSNDEFFVYGDRIAEMELVIYDRWGEKVFETTDITKGWDGTYRGEPVDPSTLAFQLKGTYISGLEFEKAGYITLIR